MVMIETMVAVARLAKSALAFWRAVGADVARAWRSKGKVRIRIGRQWLHRTAVYAAILVAVFYGVPSGALAVTLYKTDAGTSLDTAFSTPTAPGAILQSYADGAGFTSGRQLRHQSGRWRHAYPGV